VDEKGQTTKAKILVGTDVTDHYIMRSASTQISLLQRKDDEIWGSFGMYARPSATADY